MKSWIVWVLLLITAHVPVPFPDLDGENRGAPIESLTELQAWHPLFLGIRPNDDIDRGPFRSREDNQPESERESPFGSPAVVGGCRSGVVAVERTIAFGWSPSPEFCHSRNPQVLGLPLVVVLPHPGIDESPLRRIARQCVWRI